MFRKDCYIVVTVFQEIENILKETKDEMCCNAADDFRSQESFLHFIIAGGKDALDMQSYHRIVFNVEDVIDNLINKKQDKEIHFLITLLKKIISRISEMKVYFDDKLIHVNAKKDYPELIRVYNTQLEVLQKKSLEGKAIEGKAVPVSEVTVPKSVTVSSVVETLFCPPPGGPIILRESAPEPSKCLETQPKL